MPVEYQCEACNKTLRIADEYQGRKVKCPQCGNIQIAQGATSDSLVPASLQSNLPPASRPGAPQASPGFGVNNPYSPPHVSSSPELTSQKAIQNQVPAVGEVIEYAFNVWKENLLMMVAAAAIIIGISFGIAMISGVIQGIIEKTGDQATLISYIVVSNIVSQVVSAFIGIGATRFFLQVVRGGKPDLGLLFLGADRLLPILGFTILSSIALVIGFLLLIIPGIILILFYWPAYYLIIDHKTPVLQSFGLAREITKGNEANSFLLFLCGMGIAIVGFLALCIGILAAQPLVVAMYCTAYLMMSGQLKKNSGLAETSYHPA